MRLLETKEERKFKHRGKQLLEILFRGTTDNLQNNEEDDFRLAVRPALKHTLFRVDLDAVGLRVDNFEGNSVGLKRFSISIVAGEENHSIGVFSVPMCVLKTSSGQQAPVEYFVLLLV